MKTLTYRDLFKAKRTEGEFEDLPKKKIKGKAKRKVIPKSVAAAVKDVPKIRVRGRSIHGKRTFVDVPAKTGVAGFAQRRMKGWSRSNRRWAESNIAAMKRVGRKARKVLRRHKGALAVGAGLGGYAAWKRLQSRYAKAIGIGDIRKKDKAYQVRQTVTDWYMKEPKGGQQQNTEDHEGVGSRLRSWYGRVRARGKLRGIKGYASKKYGEPLIDIGLKKPKRALWVVDEWGGKVKRLRKTKKVALSTGLQKGREARFYGGKFALNPVLLRKRLISLGTLGPDYSSSVQPGAKSTPKQKQKMSYPSMYVNKPTGLKYGQEFEARVHGRVTGISMNQNDNGLGSMDRGKKTTSTTIEVQSMDTIDRARKALGIGDIRKITSKRPFRAFFRTKIGRAIAGRARIPERYTEAMRVGAKKYATRSLSVPKRYRRVVRYIKGRKKVILIPTGVGMAAASAYAVGRKRTRKIQKRQMSLSELREATGTLQRKI